MHAQSCLPVVGAVGPVESLSGLKGEERSSLRGREEPQQPH